MGGELKCFAHILKLCRMLPSARLLSHLHDIITVEQSLSDSDLGICKL